MPIEIVKTKISSQQRYAPHNLQQTRTHSSPRNIETEPGQDSSDEDKLTRRRLSKDDDGPDFSKFESRVDYANDRLRQTMVEIHDIKMYRSMNSKKISTASYVGMMDGTQIPIDREKLANGIDKDKKRVLVGAEFSRFIVNKELAKVDRLNVIQNRFHDPIEGVLKKSQKDIDDSLSETRLLKHKTRKMNDRDDPHSLDNQRKTLLEQSEEKRQFGFLHPDKVHTLEDPKPTETYVHFVLDSVNLHDEKKLERDLLQLETTLRKDLDEGVDTDSSNDDDTAKKEQRKIRRRGGYLREAQQQMMKREKAQGDHGVVGKLQADLDQLDKSLHREMIRKQHLARHTGHRSDRSIGFNKSRSMRRGIADNATNSKTSLDSTHSHPHSRHPTASAPGHRVGTGSDEDEYNATVGSSELRCNMEIIKNEELIKIKNKRLLFETSLRGHHHHDHETGNSPDHGSHLHLHDGDHHNGLRHHGHGHDHHSHNESSHGQRHVAHGQHDHVTSPHGLRSQLHSNSQHHTPSNFSHHSPGSTQSRNNQQNPISTPHPPVVHHQSPINSGRNTIISNFVSGVSTTGGISTPKQPTRPQSGSPRPPSGGVRNTAGRKTGGQEDATASATSALSGTSSIATLPTQASSFVMSPDAATLHPIYVSHNCSVPTPIHPENYFLSGINHGEQSFDAKNGKVDVEPSNLQDGHHETPFGLDDTREGKTVDSSSISVGGDSATVKSCPTVSGGLQNSVLHGHQASIHPILDETGGMDLTRRLCYVFNYINERETKQQSRSEVQEEVVEAFCDDPAKRPGNLFSQEINHRENGTMMYFVSPIATIASKAGIGNADNKVKLIPYRDPEIRNKIRKVDNITDSIRDNVDNNNIVASFKDKIQGQEMLEEFRTIHEKKASIIEARRARKAIESDMDVVREVCETVTVRSASIVKSYRDQLKENVISKEKRLHAVIQGMKEKEFQSPRKFKLRRQQFKQLDQMQTKLLDKTVPIGTKTYHDSNKMGRKSNTFPERPGSQGGVSGMGQADSEDGEDDEDGDHFDPDAPPFSFLTELKQSHFKATPISSTVHSAEDLDGSHSVMSHHEILTVTDQAERDKAEAKQTNHGTDMLKSTSPILASPRSASPPMLNLRKGAKLTEENLEAFMKQLEIGAKPSTRGTEVTLTNDHKYYHNYEQQLRGIIRKNATSEITEQHERLLSKAWFISLLRKIKKYKKSASFAKVPPSLFVLLGALQKLISVDVPLTKDILWILVNKTIKPNEHASNLVYTALQHLFDVVGVGCQEIYQHLRNENIEISPKLLMNVRRERKVLQLRAKLAAHKMSRKLTKVPSHKDTRVTFQLSPVKEDSEMSHSSSQLSPDRGFAPTVKIGKHMGASTSSSSFQLTEDSSLASSGDSELSFSVSQAGDDDESGEVDLDQFFA